MSESGISYREADLLSDIFRRAGEESAPAPKGTDASAEAPKGAKAEGSPSGPAPGATLRDKYLVMGEIGHGGMGVILEGQDLDLQRDVAIKVLRAGEQYDPEKVTRMVEEAQVQGRLEHPNICPVHELGTDAGWRLYFTMKKVNGNSLAQVLGGMRGGSAAGRAPALSHFLDIFMKVCDAVAFAHSKGVIHRDLKPENIMIGEFGEVLVMDWGLAKVVGLPDRRVESLTVSDRIEGGCLRSMDGAVIGTPSYMPPEQAEGRIAEVDERSDVYALGGILYSILTLRPPVEGADAKEVLDKVRRHDIEAPSERVSAVGGTSGAEGEGGSGSDVSDRDRSRLRRSAASAPQGSLPPQASGGSGLPPAIPKSRGRKAPPTRFIPPDLAAAAMKALSARKEDRYPSVAALKADIQAFLEGRTLAAGQYTLGQVAGKWVRRNRALAATAAAAAAILLSATAVYVVNLSRARSDALRSARRAQEEAGRAESARKGAEVKLGESLAAQGDALVSAARWREARERHLEACAVFEQAGASPLAAELGLLAVFRRSPPSLVTFARHAGPVTALAISPDGRTCATGGADRTLRVWDAATGRELRALGGFAAPVTGAAFSPDGSLLLSGEGGPPADGSSNLRLWDVASGREVRAFAGHADGVDTVAFSSDGRRVLSCGADKAARVWDAASGRELRALKGHTEWVSSAAFSSDDRFVVTSSGDTTLKLWDAATGAEIRAFTGQTGAVNAAAFSHDGRWVAAGSDDRTLRIWDAATGRELKRMSGRTPLGRGVAFSLNDRLLLAPGRDGSVMVWNADTTKLERSLEEHTNWAERVALSPDGRFAVSTGYDGVAKVWDLGAGREDRSLVGHTEGVIGLAVSPDGRLALTGSEDRTARLWDVETGRELRAFAGHSGGVSSVAFFSDGRRVATGSWDHRVKIWDAATGGEIRTLEGHTAGVTGVAVSPDGRVAASGSTDRTVRIWDLETGRVRHVLAGAASVRCVAFSPDGRYVLSGANDASVRLWDVAAGREVRSFKGHTDPVVSVAFSADGRQAVSGGGGDLLIRLWDVASGRELRTFRGHAGEVHSVALSSDGRLLLSGGFDNALKVWDAETGREIHSFAGPADRVDAVAFAPDGRTALTSSGTAAAVKIWEFGRPARHRGFAARLRQAQERFAAGPGDAAAAQAFGEWYAFRGVWDRAVEHLERAQAAGEPVSALALGRCLWQQGDIPAARREFRRAIERKEAPAAYLDLCLGVLDRSELRASSVDPATVEPGLMGEYFSGDFEAPGPKRVDPQIAFRWGLGPAWPGGPVDEFSARWTGWIRAPASGPYAFETTSDDGVRLFLDDAKVIDNWTKHAVTLDAGTCWLEKGWHRIVLEYYESVADATITLTWRTAPGRPPETVGGEWLHHAK